MVDKAEPLDYRGRFREIISDPLNLLIERHPQAGATEGNDVVLHTGYRVPFDGPGAYYGMFSLILVLNRGVHEPLEEFVFQELLKNLPPAPVMLELGAYWGHYSMWLKKVRPAADVTLVEPFAKMLAAGRQNFAKNQLDGRFIQAKVGRGQFAVDAFLATAGIPRLDILHADIQGAEVEMLEGAARTLATRAADYVFVSTHSQELHDQVRQTLAGHGYRIEVSSDWADETTAHDGLVFASSPAAAQIFNEFSPPGRSTIPRLGPAAMVAWLASTVRDHYR